MAAALPPAPAIVLTATRRYGFAVALCAGLAAGKTVILPPKPNVELIADARERYGEVVPVDDETIRSMVSAAPRGVSPEAGVVVTGLGTLDLSRGSVEVFTSGSTGRPIAHRKSWANLAGCARAYRDALPFPKGEGAVVVATVPAFHMYGLESSLLVPFVSDVTFFDGQPLFPADIRDALDSVHAPRVLVTTPVVLRGLVATRKRPADLRLVISAAAPLPAQLAAAAEDLLEAPVVEVYGFTEAGIVATRRPVEGARWRMAATNRIVGTFPHFAVSSPHLESAVAFPDFIEPLGDDGFDLVGRASGMIKVGGRRFSLGVIETAFLDVPGVHDVAVLVEDPQNDREVRPVALVVAPGRTVRELLDAVRLQLDPVCIPREILLVESLPRSATSKLSPDDLHRVLHVARGSRS